MTGMPTGAARRDAILFVIGKTFQTQALTDIARAMRGKHGRAVADRSEKDGEGGLVSQSTDLDLGAGELEGCTCVVRSRLDVHGVGRPYEDRVSER